MAKTDDQLVAELMGAGAGEANSKLFMAMFRVMAAELPTTEDLPKALPAMLVPMQSDNPEKQAKWDGLQAQMKEILEMPDEAPVP
jgi:hypothetical protein